MRNAIWLVCLIALLGWSMVCHATVDETMVLALSLDETNGNVANDATQYGNHGKIIKAAFGDGHFGGAVEFDGSASAIEVDDTPELLLLEGGTLMAWANIQTDSGHASWPRVIIKSTINGGTEGYDFLFDRAAGYAIRFCAGGECNSYVPVETDVWHHVAVTFGGFAGDDILIYLDGVEVGAGAMIGDAKDMTGIPVHIGNGAANDRAYDGLLDEVRIWNRVLEADEIEWQMGRTAKEVLSVDPFHKMSTTWSAIKSTY